MSLNSGFKQAIADSLAAIDLTTELLEEQRRSLEGLLQRDQQPIQTSAPSTPAVGHRRHHRKGPASTLIITIEGKTIAEPQAATGMVKAIEHIGPARLESLGLRLGGQSLIIQGAKPPGRGYRSSGSWWIATHSDTAEKRNVLEKICRRLGLSFSVRQVSKSH